MESSRNERLCPAAGKEDTLVLLVLLALIVSCLFLLCQFTARQYSRFRRLQKQREEQCRFSQGYVVSTDAIRHALQLKREQNSSYWELKEQLQTLRNVQRSKNAARDHVDSDSGQTRSRTQAKVIALRRWVLLKT